MPECSSCRTHDDKESKTRQERPGVKLKALKKLTFSVPLCLAPHLFNFQLRDSANHSSFNICHLTFNGFLFYEYRTNGVAVATVFAVVIVDVIVVELQASCPIR